MLEALQKAKLKSVAPEDQHNRGAPNLTMPSLRTEPKELEFLFYLPKNWDAKFTFSSDPNFKWPLVIYLHGSDVRHKGLEAIKSNGLPCWIEQSMKTNV